MVCCDRQSEVFMEMKNSYVVVFSGSTLTSPTKQTRIDLPENSEEPVSPPGVCTFTMNNVGSHSISEPYRFQGNPTKDILCRPGQGTDVPSEQSQKRSTRYPRDPPTQEEVDVRFLIISEN